MDIIYVALEDGTIGSLLNGQQDAEIGDTVEVRLHDENGQQITKEGRLAEVL